MAGLFCGVGLIVIGVTGSLLVFHDGINTWCFPTDPPGAALRTGTTTFYGNVPTPNPLRGDFGSRVTFHAADGALQSVVDIRRGSA